MKSTLKSRFHEQVEAMLEGFRRFPLPNIQLMLHGEPLLPTEMACRLQEMLHSFEAVREAEAWHREAREAHLKSLPSFRAFYADAVTLVKAHFGSDPRVLAGFGLRGASSRKRGREVVVGEEDVVIEGPRGEVAKVEEVVEVEEPHRLEEGEERHRKSAVPAMPLTPAMPVPATVPLTPVPAVPVASELASALQPAKAKPASKRKGGKRR